LTNRCTNTCYFCPRNAGGDYVAGHYLRLNTEPSADHILKLTDMHTDFDEIVFCGLGEPTLRLRELLEIAGKLKDKGHFVRLNTNGHGSLVNKVDLPSRLPGLVDKVSVSLNAPDEETYERICKPDRGRAAYAAVIDFIKGSVANNIETDVTAVDLPEIDTEACRKLAESLGARFRLRRYNK
jgi:TatD DNase family protein